MVRRETSMAISVTSKMSPIVYKSCPKMISLEELKDLNRILDKKFLRM